MHRYVNNGYLLGVAAGSSREQSLKLFTVFTFIVFIFVSMNYFGTIEREGQFAKEKGKVKHLWKNKNNRKS